MLASAMTISAEGILGFWNGTPSLALPGAGAGWRAFAQLQGNARMAVLQHELAPLFRVATAGTGYQVAVPVGGATPLLTLVPPGIPQLAAQLTHVRTASDLRADRLPEILSQMGDMLSFYGAHFRLHPDARKWTLHLLSAVYEAVLIPEMRLKFHASLPRPFDFAPEVQPIIETPAHSTYPSGHATEAFAFAAVLSGLNHAAAGAADPVGAVLADLASPTAATDAATLPFRLAARIADNRTVAGVHFPVDSAHGALLGLSCGLAALAACMPQATTVPVYAADGGNWLTDFTLDNWLLALPGWATGATVVLPGAAPADILALLYAEAVAEWT
jgi:hypothetical protein